MTELCSQTFAYSPTLICIFMLLFFTQNELVQNGMYIHRALLKTLAIGKWYGIIVNSVSIKQLKGLLRLIMNLYIPFLSIYNIILWIHHHQKNYFLAFGFFLSFYNVPAMLSGLKFYFSFFCFLTLFFFLKYF